WERLTRDHPQNPEFQAGLAQVYFCEGKLLHVTGRRAEAKKSYESALAIYEKLTRAEPSNTLLQKEYALCQARIGNLLGRAGTTIEAMKAYESALAILENLIKATPTKLNEIVSFKSDLAGVYMNIGTLQARTGQSGEALKSFEKALMIWQNLARYFPD